MTLPGSQRIVSSMPTAHRETNKVLLFPHLMTSILLDKMDPTRTPGMPRSALVKLQDWLQAALPDAAKLHAAAPNHSEVLVSKIHENSEAATLLSAAEAAAKSMAKSQVKELRRIGVNEDKMKLEMDALCSSAALYNTPLHKRITSLIKELRAELRAAEDSLPDLAQKTTKRRNQSTAAWNNYKNQHGNLSSQVNLQIQTSYARTRTRARKARNAETRAKEHIRSLETSIRVYELLAERFSPLNEVLAAKELLQDTQKDLQTAVAQFVQIFEKGIFAELAAVRPKMQKQYLAAVQLNDFEVAFVGPVRRTATTEKLTEVCALDREIRMQETTLLSQLDSLKMRETALNKARITLSDSMDALAVCLPAQFAATSESFQRNYSALAEAAHTYLNAGKTVTDAALHISDLRESAHAEVARLGIESTTSPDSVRRTLAAPDPNSQKPTNYWASIYPI